MSRQNSPRAAAKEEESPRSPSPTTQQPADGKKLDLSADAANTSSSIPAINSSAPQTLQSDATSAEQKKSDQAPATLEKTESSNDDAQSVGVFSASLANFRAGIQMAQDIDLTPPRASVPPVADRKSNTQATQEEARVISPEQKESSFVSALQTAKAYAQSAVSLLKTTDSKSIVTVFAEYAPSAAFLLMGYVMPTPYSVFLLLGGVGYAAVKARVEKAESNAIDHSADMPQLEQKDQKVSSASNSNDNEGKKEEFSWNEIHTSVLKLNAESKYVLAPFFLGMAFSQSWLVGLAIIVGRYMPPSILSQKPAASEVKESKRSAQSPVLEVLKSLEAKLNLLSSEQGRSSERTLPLSVDNTDSKSALPVGAKEEKTSSLEPENWRERVKKDLLAGVYPQVGGDDGIERAKKLSAEIDHISWCQFLERTRNIPGNTLPELLKNYIYEQAKKVLLSGNPLVGSTSNLVAQKYPNIDFSVALGCDKRYRDAINEEFIKNNHQAFAQSLCAKEFPSGVQEFHQLMMQAIDHYISVVGEKNDKATSGPIKFQRALRQIADKMDWGRYLITANARDEQYSKFPEDFKKDVLNPLQTIATAMLKIQNQSASKLKSPDMSDSVPPSPAAMRGRTVSSAVFTTPQRLVSNGNGAKENGKSFSGVQRQQSTAELTGSISPSPSMGGGTPAKR